MLVVRHFLERFFDIVAIDEYGDRLCDAEIIEGIHIRGTFFKVSVYIYTQ